MASPVSSAVDRELIPGLSGRDAPVELPPVMMESSNTPRDVSSGWHTGVKVNPQGNAALQVPI
jgi:hypothetical protein